MCQPFVCAHLRAPPSSRPAQFRAPPLLPLQFHRFSWMCQPFLFSCLLSISTGFPECHHCFLPASISPGHLAGPTSSEPLHIPRTAPRAKAPEPPQKAPSPTSQKSPSKPLPDEPTSQNYLSGAIQGFSRILIKRATRLHLRSFDHSSYDFFWQRVPTPQAMELAHLTAIHRTTKVFGVAKRQ